MNTTGYLHGERGLLPTTEIVAYIKGVLMKIARGTVDIESLSSAPAVCTPLPALHSLSVGDRLVLEKLDTETDEPSTSQITIAAIPCSQTPSFHNHHPRHLHFYLHPTPLPISHHHRLTLPLPRLSTQSPRDFVRHHQPRISRCLSLQRHTVLPQDRFDSVQPLVACQLHEDVPAVIRHCE